MRRYDKRTFSNRLLRLDYVTKIFPRGLMYMLPPESAFVFEEAKMSFINGQFVSTILLSQAFIEHMFQNYVQSIGNKSLAKSGLAAITRFLRKGNIVHPFLLDKIDQLRLIRNPFTHLPAPGSPHSISQRAFQKQQDPYHALATDAAAALGLMYQIAITKI
jgi:hypothetical protein